MCDETLLNQFLDSGHIQENALAAAIAKEAVFPCYFGSALKLEGVVGVFGRAGTIHPGAGLPPILPRQGVQDLPR